MSLNCVCRLPRSFNYRRLLQLKSSSNRSTNSYPIIESGTYSWSINCKRNKGSSGASGFEDLDKPIKFTTSKAATWSAQDTFHTNDDTPSIQGWMGIFSVSCFLIYFLYLREENDVDEEMKKSLWERIPGLEKSQLHIVYNYNLEHGISTREIVDRLKEIEEQEEREKQKQKATR